MAKNTKQTAAPMNDTQITTKDVLLYHWRQAKKFPKLVALALVITPVTIVLERYITPLIIATLLFTIQAGDVTLASSWWLIAAYGAAHIFSHVVGYRIVMWAMWGVQIAGIRRIYEEVYEKLTRQSLDFYSNNFAGSLARL